MKRFVGHFYRGSALLQALCGLLLLMAMARPNLLPAAGLAGLAMLALLLYAAGCGHHGRRDSGRRLWRLEALTAVLLAALLPWLTLATPWRVAGLLLLASAGLRLLLSRRAGALRWPLQCSVLASVLALLSLYYLHFFALGLLLWNLGEMQEKGR